MEPSPGPCGSDGRRRPRVRRLSANRLRPEAARSRAWSRGPSPSTRSRPSPAAPTPPPSTCPSDTDARRRIEAARDYIEAKRWEEVVEALQRVLDDPQDKFAPLPRKGPDGKEVVVPTSVRAEANRLLAGLPNEGLEAYKVYKDAGPKADEYLKKAKDATTVEDRLANLGLVVRNYLHTDAGGEAADLLATHYMDRGDFRTAGRFYGLLLTRAGGVDALPADMLFRAAYAFDQADDKADEDLVWQSASAPRHPRHQVRRRHPVGFRPARLPGRLRPHRRRHRPSVGLLPRRRQPHRPRATAAPPSCAL